MHPRPTPSRRRSSVRFVVIGAGAIGGGLGGALARTGADVHLVARGAHLQALQQGGMRLRTPEHDARVAVPASALCEVVPGPQDVVCLATKLQDAEDALAAVRARWGDVPVVTWTNGLSADGWASVWASTVVATVQFVPASAPVQGEAWLWGTPHPGVVHASTVRGDSDRVRDALVAALSQAGFEARGHGDVRPIQHTKWVRNLAGAVQALVVPADWEALIPAVQGEGERVLRAAGLPIAPSEALLPEVPMTLGTIDGRQRRGGSTRQSLLDGKSLETPFLNGALVALARTVGVATPLNAWLVAGAVRAVEEGWREGRLTA